MDEAWMMKDEAVGGFWWQTDRLTDICDCSHFCNWKNPSNRFSINKLPELIVLPTSLKAFEDWRLWRLCLLWRLWRYWPPKMLWRFMTKHHVSVKHILTPVLWKILIEILRLIWTKIFWKITQLSHTHTLCDWQGGL